MFLSGEALSVQGLFQFVSFPMLCCPVSLKSCSLWNLKKRYILSCLWCSSWKNCFLARQPLPLGSGEAGTPGSLVWGCPPPNPASWKSSEDASGRTSDLHKHQIRTLITYDVRQGLLKMEPRPRQELAFGGEVPVRCLPALPGRPWNASHRWQKEELGPGCWAPGLAGSGHSALSPGHEAPRVASSLFLPPWPCTGVWGASQGEEL